ncbi:hypothetical protein WAI453_007937 [Rhynchosporium graminicola]
MNIARSPTCPRSKPFPLLPRSSNLLLIFESASELNLLSANPNKPQQYSLFDLQAHRPNEASLVTIISAKSPSLKPLLPA